MAGAVAHHPADGVERGGICVLATAAGNAATDCSANAGGDAA